MNGPRDELESPATDRVAGPDQDADDRSGQYLTFRLADETYGVDILRICEIRSWDSVTPVPNTGDSVLGVLNLRGTIIPIIDLRIHFDLPKGEIRSTTVVVVLRVEAAQSSRTMGLLVDAVSDVHTLTKDQLRTVPDIQRVASGSLIGLAEIGDDVITLLDIDALLSTGDLVPELLDVE